MLMVSSTDGYCSIITFGPGELGVPYEPKEESVSSSKAPVGASLPDNKKSEDVNSAISIQSDLVASIDLAKDEDDYEGIKKLDEECSEEKKCDAGNKPCSTPETKSQKSSVEKTVGSSHSTEQNQTNFDDCKSPESNTVKSSQGTYSTNVPVTEEIVTPGNSGKKARRVQLITLSSPKSRKKLL